VKILFVCGGLEKGRDGVGDYCWRMATAGRDAGWEPALLAIHDGAVRTVTEETGTIRALRLPRAMPWSERRRHAAALLAAERPDWVSVQFVAYALAPSGVILRWVPRLASLLAGQRVHLLFHEIWIGDATEYGLRDRAIGAAQRLAIRLLVERLRPAAAHTSNHAYQQLLAQIGVRAGRLPLPGNIPISTSTEPVPGFPSVARAGCRIGGVFGTIHPRWQSEPWLGESCALAERAGRKLVLLQFGEAGHAGRERWSRLAAECRNRVDCIALGPREPEEISRILTQLDFGVATSPWALIEKSGSTAAFLDHGVPVLVPRDDWQLRDGFTPDPAGDPLLFRSPAALFRSPRPRGTPRDRIAQIATALMRELSLGAATGIAADYAN
jgi:hypothetical protein